MAPWRIRTLMGVALAILTAIAGCGGDDDGTSAVSTTDPANAPSTTSPTTTSATEPATTTSAVETRTTELPAAPLSDAELPGQSSELVPPAGTLVGVVGVAVGGHLNVRLGPGVDRPVGATLAPLQTDVPLTGRSRLVSDELWWELDLGAGVGWSSAKFLAPFAAQRDETARVVADLGQGPPTAADIEALGALIAALYADFDEPEPAVVVVGGPRSIGGLGEIVIDVLNYPDDAIYGDRLTVKALVSGGQPALNSVSARALCRRGVSEGLCV